MLLRLSPALAALLLQAETRKPRAAQRSLTGSIACFGGEGHRMAMSIGLERLIRRVQSPLVMLVVFGVGAGFFSNKLFQLPSR